MFNDDYKDMINNIEIDKSEQDKTLEYILGVAEDKKPKWYFKHKVTLQISFAIVVCVSVMIFVILSQTGIITKYGDNSTSDNILSHDDVNQKNSDTNLISRAGGFIVYAGDIKEDIVFDVLDDKGASDISTSFNIENQCLVYETNLKVVATGENIKTIKYELENGYIGLRTQYPDELMQMEKSLSSNPVTEEQRKKLNQYIIKLQKFCRENDVLQTVNQDKENYEYFMIKKYQTLEENDYNNQSQYIYLILEPSKNKQYNDIQDLQQSIESSKLKVAVEFENGGVEVQEFGIKLLYSNNTDEIKLYKR